ncbi:hypothetical protein [Dictyobacter kobayashii]|uniref:DUF2335 domain-containing protein n=1 Tax=Dictyobacter kobayashii TaxID=2014872 RepID=A0A402AI10_9CHLR|nr:hypothetical protein [Dictyobacter kobayashii]GCE18674.1 hypothetical protein KDK_24740 [Dictyobacter kobayashii]
MKEYEDPHKHLARHMDAAAKKYAEGLIQAGIDEPSPLLTRAMAERALQDAQKDYERESLAVLNHNIEEIMKEASRLHRQARRKDAPVFLGIFSFIAFVFSIMACMSFLNHNVVLGCSYCLGVAVFSLLIIGVGIDLLRKDR